MVATDLLVAFVMVGSGFALLLGGGLYMVLRPGFFVHMDHEIGSLAQWTVDTIHDRWGERYAVRFVQAIGAFLALGAVAAAAAMLLL